MNKMKGKWFNFVRNFEMEQWQLNTLIVTASTLVILLIIATVFGFNPLGYVANIAVWILAVPGVLFVLPGFLGYFVSYQVVHRLDESVDNSKGLGFTHVFSATLTATILAALWGKVVIYWLIKLPQLTVWAWEGVRFPSAYETMPWEWFACAAICGLVGYAFGAMQRDMES